MRRTLLGSLLAVGFVCGLFFIRPWPRLHAADATAGANALAAARHLFLTGNEAEAIDALTPLAERDPTAALLLARATLAHGQANAETAAEEQLQAAAKRFPKASAFPAERARLAFARGDEDLARAQVAEALRIEPDELMAHWIDAELDRVVGKLPDAEKKYRWFVDYYNAHEEKSPDALRIIGWGAAQFARWKRLQDQFSFLVNDLYPDCLKLDADYWPAHYESGCLFLEKYNQAEASKEFKAALAINPNAAVVYTAQAELALQSYDLAEAKTNLDRALKLDPDLNRAYLLQARLHLANFAADEAIQVLERARQRASFNKLDEETLGTLAAAYAAVDGRPEHLAGSRAGKLAAEVDARNPHAGVFYFALASGLDAVRKFPAAAQFYEEASRRMPQLLGPKSELGLMWMRLGKEVEAEQVLKAAFDEDPFNIRVSNTLKVLDVLAGYAVIETDHFVIKFDRGRDELLAKYAARYLEHEVYPELTKKLGYVPPDKSLFEIFNRAKNTDGHGWFSARMVGLPYIGTVGACAGKMVALSSPNDAKQKFNWARVLKHEFVHVLNLQQTNYNIPHWYTEALAVYNEGYPRPREWVEVLAERRAAGTLFNLETINLGFIRPHSSQDWTLAYCQAELYAEYMLDQYGPDALAQMLTAYADNLTTPAALERSFHVPVADFEQGYQAFLQKTLADAAPSNAAAPTLDFAALVKAQADKPHDADLAGRLALEYLRRKNLPQARALVAPLLKQNPKDQLAAYVMARLKLSIGENDEALALLRGALDREQPQDNLLGLLAGLELKAEKYDAAAELYELGAKREPHNLQWPQLLARVYLLSKNNAKLGPVLARLADADADDAPLRKKLAQLAWDRHDAEATAKWALQAIYIDVQDGDSHRLLALALTAKKDWSRAFEEYDAAVQLLPQDLQLRYTWAEAALAAGQPAQAKLVLDKLLVLEPQFPGAKELAARIAQAAHR